MASTVAVDTAPAAGQRRAYRPATFLDALRSEWTKLRSVRSTYWALIVAAVLGIGLGALISGVSANHYATDPTVQSELESRRPQPQQPGHRPAGLRHPRRHGRHRRVLDRHDPHQPGGGPQARRLLGAKALVWAAVALVAGEIISFVTFLVGQALISGQGALDHPRPATTCCERSSGAGLYLAVLGVLGSALGVLLRHAAAAIGSIVAILLVLPGIAAALPSRGRNPIEQWWPTNAGQQVAVIVRDAHTLPAWAGFGVMAAFTAIVLAAAFVVLERRDA